MLNIVTLLCYIAGGITQVIFPFNKNTLNKTRKLLFGLGIPAIILHSYLLHNWIDLGTGQNLTELNLFSLASWLSAVIILLLAVKNPVSYLSIFIFPIAALSIYLASHFPANHVIQTAANPKQFFHIILSVITFSVLSIAGLQAITLAAQELLLKRKHFEIPSTLPPLESMEKLLFQMIAIGSVLLTCLLATSIYFFHHILLKPFIQKTVLTLMSWLVFTLLLVGRCYFGWRGRKAVYCTLGGLFLLSLIYFGSILIMRLIP